jgi:hypothetical protein
LGDRRYSSYSFLTSALERGEWSASCPGRALPPGKEPPVPSVQEAGWAPEPVWTQRLEEKSSASVGDRTPAVQAVVRHYTDWATRLILRKIHEIKGAKEAANRGYWFLGYFTTLSWMISRQRYERWQTWSIWSYYLTWRDKENQEKLRIFSSLIKIWTAYSMNRNSGYLVDQMIF